MTERTAMRILWVSGFLAAVFLVVAVKALDASDEVFAIGTMILIAVGSLTAGQITVHYGPSRHRDKD